MKKRFIALFVVMLMVATMFTACAGTTHSETVQEVEGSFHMFWTESDKEYLNFLETFDETKYELVDISHSKYNNWYVTYKDIEE